MCYVLFRIIPPRHSQSLKSPCRRHWRQATYEAVAENANIFGSTGVTKHCLSPRYGQFSLMNQDLETMAKRSGNSILEVVTNDSSDNFELRTARLPNANVGGEIDLNDSA